MRCFEATGMGADLISDGANLKELWPDDGESHEAVTPVDQDWSRFQYGPKSLREHIAGYGRMGFEDYENFGWRGQAETLTRHTYIQRVPELVALARSL